MLNRKTIVVIGFTALSCYASDKPSSVAGISERKGYFEVTIKCSNRKGVIDVSFFNPFGTYIHLAESYNGTGILRKIALQVIKNDTYTKHYTKWLNPPRIRVNDFERSDSVKEIILPPYSKRNFSLKYDNLFRFNLNEKYILYFTSAVNMTMGYSTNFKTLYSNQLLLNGNECNS